MKLLPHHVRIPFPCGKVYVLWKDFIHPENIVIVQAGMNVDMQVRHFLKGGRPNGMPNANAVVRKGAAYRTRDLRDRVHERRASVLVQSPHVIDVGFWNYKNMPRVRLAKVNEGKRLLILKYNTGRSRPIDDAAEDAVMSHVLSMQA